MPIKKLSVQLANQIAAGEVVENPASVVKELLENAIDAHATAITLEVRDAGKLLIKVTDNGLGVPHEELPLALAPHATSKIHELKDLDGIVTLGFRGEALASIAAVSKLSLLSNTAGQDHGYKVEVEGPEQHPYIYPAAHPIGTTVIVRELFFNTPARRRFLKSDKTELAKVKDIFTRIALVNYTCEFNLIVDGRMVLQVPATNRSGLSQRIPKLLGAEYKGTLIKIDSADPDFQQSMQELYNEEHFNVDESNSLKFPPVITMHGVLVYPELARRGLADKLIFFLNGRCMGDKLVARAIKEGVTQALEATADFKPSIRGVIFLECDPHIVDVNVHPRKDEVRFHQGHVIFNCISTTVKTALYRHGLNAHTFGRGSLGLNDLSPAPAPAPAPSPASTPIPAHAPAVAAPVEVAAATSDPEPAPAAPAPAEQDGVGTIPVIENFDDVLEEEPNFGGAIGAGSATGRESELRACVEQYFSTHPSAIFNSSESSSAHRTLPGACCDLSKLQSGMGALSQLRAAAAAVKAYRSTPDSTLIGQKSENAAPPAPNPVQSLTDDSALSASTAAPRAESDEAAATGEEIYSSSSTSGLNLSSLLLRQERARRHLESEEEREITETGVNTIEDTELSAEQSSAGQQSSNVLTHSRGFAKAMGILQESRSRYDVAVQEGDENTSTTVAASSTAQVPASAALQPHMPFPAFLPAGAAAATAAAASAAKQGAMLPAGVAYDTTKAYSTANTACSTITSNAEQSTQPEQAVFLALIAPNVLLFSLKQHYFLGKGSELLAECLAREYSLQVRENKVQSAALRVPFAIRVESELIKSYKQEQTKKAALRCGFSLEVRAAKALLELHRVPAYLLGCNLAPVAHSALRLIAAHTQEINGETLESNESNAPLELCQILANAREYEINTEFDARALLGNICSFEQLTPLLEQGTLKELNLMQLAQQLLNHQN